MAASDTRSGMMFDEVIVQIVSQKLGTLLSHPVCVECLLMQTRVKDAKVKLARIQEFFTQYRPSEATEWSGRLLRAMHYAEEFIDKFHLREARKRHKALPLAAWPLAALVSKYKLWRDLSILVSEMEELCHDQYLKGEAEDKSKKKPVSSSSHASVPWQGQKFVRLTSYWDRQAPTNFSCREDEKKKIIKLLIETKEYSEISIWGEQGTGKTFLARWAYSQAKYMGYNWRAWVHVSPSMDWRDFLLETLRQAESLAGDVKHMRIADIETKLKRRLAQLNKFLIVLDDVQLSNWWSLLGSLYIFLRGTQTRVITTTQYEEIALYMCYKRSQSPYPRPIKLGKLDDEESQKMLDWKLHGVPDGQRLSNEEKDTLNMCRGLPLCISLLGGFLSNAGEHERATLVEEGSTMALLDIIQLSYHKLPVHLKPCFIYMALFPIAFPIPTRRLVRLWLAEGLLDSHCYDIERERKRQPEDVGETFILELVDRNVIDVVSWRADGSPKACQMLTYLYDVIHPIAMSTGLLYVHPPSKSKDGNDRDPSSRQKQLPAQLRERTKIRWLAKHTDIVEDDRSGSYPDLNLGHVRSFISFSKRRGILTKDIGTFLRRMTSKTDYSLLRVLDLEGVYKPSLNGVLCKLVLLRYLGLRSTLLELLPSTIADLHHLETLDIKHTGITSLPSSLWKAGNLRHLHLNWFYIDWKKILGACSNTVNALTQLQTLSGLVIGEVKENLMRDRMDSLTTLTMLKLFLQRSSGETSGAAGKTVANWISFRLTNLQTLTFGVIHEDKPTKKDKPKKEHKPAEEARPPKVAQPGKEDKPTKKEAKPVTSWIGPLPELSLARKHHELFELYLLGQLNKPIWTQLLPGSLRVLTLSGSRAVEADMMAELGGLLRNLRTFRLLANSFLCKSMRFVKDGFPSLMILKIWKLPQLEDVVIEEGAMLHLKELEFRHLKSLKTIEGIDYCEELENICVVSKKAAPNFVDSLNKKKREKTNFYIKEEVKALETTDDDGRPADDEDASP